MDRSEVEAFVRRKLPELQRVFGLDRWTILLQFGPRDLRGPADCDRDARYDLATIGFDPEKIDDPQELETFIRHELFHIVHSPFDLFWSLATASLDDADMERARRAWSFASEQQVLVLERLYQGLAAHFSTPPPSKVRDQRCDSTSTPKSRPKAAATPRAKPPKSRPT
jgi:hypothetical protein